MFRNIAISILGIVLGYFLSMPTIHGVCGYWNVSCGNIVGGIFGTPLFLFSLVSFFLFVIFLFVHDIVYKYWIKFSKIYLPVAIILIILSPVVSQSFVGFYRELTTQWLAGIFLISSLGIIIYKSLKK